MKRWVFFLTGIVLVSVVVGIQSCKMYYTPQKVTYGAIDGALQVQEGKRLTMLICGPCHYDPLTKKLSGIKMDDIPGFVGKVYSKNITRHPGKGISAYSDAELAYLIRTGVARNGKLMPYMQKPNLADEDLNSIIVFLRSDDELVAAADNDPGQTKYTPMGKFGISRSKPLPWSPKEISKPAKTDKAVYGRYLVDNLSCYDCHSKSFMSINKMDPGKSKGYMGGGNKLKDKSGAWVKASNLTPHETGLGNWTEQDFIKAMRMGISKDNTIITYPMPKFSELTEDELLSIYAYLKTLPAIKNKIKHS